MRSWDVGLVCGSSSAGSGELMIDDALLCLLGELAFCSEPAIQILKNAFRGLLRFLERAP